MHDDTPNPAPIQTDHHRALYEGFGYGPGATAHGRFAFLSGQVGLEEDGSVSEDPDTQIRRLFANLKAVLDAVPAGPRDVVDMTSFHVGMERTMERMFCEKAAFFGDWNPAWTAIGVSELALPGLMLELRVVVRVPDATN